MPTVLVAVLIVLLSRPQVTSGMSEVGQSAVIIFGFLITCGLTIYDHRNSQLYDDLISRGCRIEEELGIDTGQFRGRGNPSNFLINHSNATNLIYGTALTGWIFALVATWAGWIQ